MKATLFIILLFSISTLQAQIVNIPDPVFKQALLDHGFFTGIEIDTNFDGEIQVSEAEAITGFLDVNGQFIDIYDLTGIEAFINITELWVFWNQLTSLDLSNNVLLERLECFYNQLTSLDVSQCTLLEELAAFGNLLVSLDLSNSLNLQRIILSNNLLVNLDLTNNLNLQGLSLSSNQLTFLDLRSGNNTNITGYNSNFNPDLTCIFVDDAAYSEANWSGTDPASTFVETQAECDALGLNDNFFQEINIYPNPVNNILYIDNYDLRFTNNDLQIIDITGKTVQQLTISKPQSSINVSHLLTGIYFLQLQNNSSTILTKKIIKL